MFCNKSYKGDDKSWQCIYLALFSRKGGIRQIDNIRHMMDIGTDTYHTGKVSRAHLAELKRILSESQKIMKNYGVEAYTAYGTSAFREMKNSSMMNSQPRSSISAAAAYRCPCLKKTS